MQKKLNLTFLVSMYTSHMSFQMLSSSETLPISFTPKIHAWLFVRTRKSSIAGDASSIVLKQPEKKKYCHGMVSESLSDIIFACEKEYDSSRSTENRSHLKVNRL